MSDSTTPPTFAGTFPEAWRELRKATEAFAMDAWPRVLEAISPAAREASLADGTTSERYWVEALDAADAIVAATSVTGVSGTTGVTGVSGAGLVARAVGAARFDALWGDGLARYEGDPIAFLRAEAASFYRFRATYGAASLEFAPQKAVVRFVASAAWLRRGDGRPSVAPLAPLGFLDHAIERLSGAPGRGRYLGPARRADTLGGVELFNLLYEYALDAD